MAVVRMLLVGVVLTLMSFGPVAAQNMAETVLRELVQELGPSGAKISKRSQTAVENGVEWRDVVITLPRIQGRLELPFLRAVEVENNAVAITYPDTITGVATPVRGLPAIRMTVTGAIDHVIQKPGRAQVHDVRMDGVTVTLVGTKPASQAILTITDFDLKHTEDVGVPLRLNRIRDVPMSGAFDLHVYGGLAALDLLIGMGEVSEQQGDFARMVASMFAVKGAEGEDHLNVKIEARKNGAFLINGNPL
ncbi:hypothetical protein [Amylibacter sp. IMCC11727]|uniref:hypothetical protein n=1 Tax=Amylibacter sp. IMCC11727 TaxID=3039851 RepID=UPI00244DF249|nr:hypothetical protein [Amylibacter sp. IMCC11727]WGI22266.1 hypothetical protein QBD29_02260 [Amylibacter sp. IMCC11727]